MKEAQYLRVMVVDDMAVNRKIISRILLRKFKVTAKEASGGAECQDLCREGQGFDLVLMGPPHAGNERHRSHKEASRD